MGRIKTIEAPVVPRKLADKVPKARIAVLVAGVPDEIAAHPDAAGDDEKSEQEKDESRAGGCAGTSSAVVWNPKTTSHGTRKASAQNAATLPKWCSQKCGGQEGEKRDGEQEAGEGKRADEA
jgi:hypothetical protein